MSPASFGFLGSDSKVLRMSSMFVGTSIILSVRAVYLDFEASRFSGILDSLQSKVLSVLSFHLALSIQGCSCLTLEALSRLAYVQCRFSYVAIIFSINGCFYIHLHAVSEMPSFPIIYLIHEFLSYYFHI